MSIDKIKQAKGNGIFKKGDIIVYSLILVVVIVLFISIFATQSTAELTNIDITLNDEKVFTYNFIEKKYEVFNNSLVVVDKETDILYLTIYKDENKNHFNKVEIDIKSKKVYLKSANCSASKDCTHMIIEKVGDNIICAPHNLIISTNKKEKVVNPTVG